MVGNVSGGGTFDHGALAPISATVSDGYRFGGWSGEGIADVSALETTVMMGEESTVRASFVKVWNLEVGGNEGGAVEGSGVVDAGISTPIVAIVSEGYRFDGWTGPNIAGSNMRGNDNCGECRHRSDGKVCKGLEVGHYQG